MTQPRRMLLSSFHLIDGTIITPLVNFHLDLGLGCDQTYRFVQYTPMKALIALFSLQWILGEKVMKIHTRM